jgi:transaldolase
MAWKQRERKEMLMHSSALAGLKRHGQSVWIDYLSRETLDTGELARMIRDDGVSGVTDNPAIFQRAISSSRRYDSAINTLAKAHADEQEIYTSLIIEDVAAAADLLTPVYDDSEGDDGYVSLEVSPHLARDAHGTILEARSLWERVSRPNLLIKVPGTAEGLVAVRQLISDGINVNITLLFGIPRYRETAEAFVAGLEDRVKDGLPIDNVASVASFFLSRIDALLDPILESIIKVGGAKAEIARPLIGEIAIASAKEAYSSFKEVFFDARFKALAAKGGRMQKVLWASTGTKNPAYSDVKYVDSLIGPYSINTMPVETLAAYRDHGQPAPRLEQGLENARKALKSLADVGIDLDRQTQLLEDEGIVKFNEAHDAVMAVIEKHRVPVY